jgi:hypothetical protein
VQTVQRSTGVVVHFRVCNMFTTKTKTNKQIKTSICLQDIKIRCGHPMFESSKVY